MKTKLLSLALVVAMLASMLVLAPVSGATESRATLEFGNAVGVKGDTVTVDFTVTTEALSSIQFMFEYDASRLTYDGIEWTTAAEHGGAGFPADLSTNPAFIYFTEKGPYSVPNWSTGMNVGAIDLQAGGTLATLSFTIKDDAPLGEAYVKFAPLKNPDNAAVMVNKVVATNAEDVFGSDDMTFVDGAVTVLPEGYASYVASPETDFVWDYWDGEDITEGVSDGATGIAIMEYIGEEGGAVVIPETIEGLPVVAIYEEAFNGADAVTSLVIPETVEVVGTKALWKMTSLKSLFVMGDLDLTDSWVGCAGTTSKPKAICAEDEVTLLTTVYAVEGSAATEYKVIKNSVGVPVNFALAEALYVVAIEGASVVALSNAPAPGVMETADGLAVAWTDGTNTYAAGQNMELKGDCELTAAKVIAKPQTSTEVGLKLADPLSMRFKATFGVDDYATLKSLGTVELGMLITPAKYVSHAGAFTKEALAEFKVGDTTYTLGANAYVDVALNGYFSKTADEYTFAARLENFSATTLKKNPDFAAVMYATVTTADGATFTVYGDFNFAANTSVLEVAENTSTEGQTDPIKNAVAALISTLKGEEA